jgi:hypothetical protein
MRQLVGSATNTTSRCLIAREFYRIELDDPIRMGNPNLPLASRAILTYYGIRNNANRKRLRFGFQFPPTCACQNLDFRIFERQIKREVATTLLAKNSGQSSSTHLQT